MKGLDDIKGLARSAFQSPAIKLGAAAVLAGALTTTQDAVAAENGTETDTFHKDLCVSEETYDARIESGQYQEVLSYTVGPFTKKSVSDNIIRQEIREEIVINDEGDEWAKMQPQPQNGNQYCAAYHGVEPDIVDIQRDPRETLNYDYGQLDDWDNEELAQKGMQVCRELYAKDVVEDCGTHYGLMNDFYNEGNDYGMAFRGIRLMGDTQMLTTVNVHNNGALKVTHSSPKGFYLSEKAHPEFRYGDRAQAALRQAREQLSMHN